MTEIYLDNSATTRLCTEGLEAWQTAVSQTWGNPSSMHSAGLAASHALDGARRALMSAVGLKKGDLIFTGSGSEANNMAIFGRAYAKARFRDRHARVIISHGEHASVRLPAARLASEGFDVISLPAPAGKIDPALLSSHLDKNTVLVSIMHTNNETGAVYDIPGISRLVSRLSPDALLHCDATQGLFHGCKDLSSLGAHMISFSAHKLEGPRGIGALWLAPELIRRGSVAPILLGGGQEQGMRPGTSDLPSAAAFAAAAARASKNYTEELSRLRMLRDFLLCQLAERPELCEVRPNIPEKAAPHIVSLTLPRIKSETMLNHLAAAHIYVSSGSACSSHKREPSAALTSFGLTEVEADCTVRVSLGRHNTKEELQIFCDRLAEGLAGLVRF